MIGTSNCSRTRAVGRSHLFSTDQYVILMYLSSIILEFELYVIKCLWITIRVAYEELFEFEVFEFAVLESEAHL